MMRFITAPFRRFRKSEDGQVGIEFALLFPVFFAIFLAGFELAFTMVRQMWLERAVDLTVRDLRLGTWPSPSHDLLKDSICDSMGNLLGNCSDNLMLEMVAVDRDSWNTPNPAASCVDRSSNIRPTVSFDPGSENGMVIMRACIWIDPIFPGTTWAVLTQNFQANDGDGIPLVATTGFVNEPGTGTES